jgi:CheY-like chemotaxis protein
MPELYASPTRAATPRGLRVLLVDDSPELRDCIKGALERAGLTVVGEAADGLQALAQAAAQRPDVVLMDLRMPGMDGIVATRALRLQQPDTPVVLWTGDGDALDGAVRESGAYAGLSKGVRLSELVATLRRIGSRAGGGPDPR